MRYSRREFNRLSALAGLGYLGGINRDAEKPSLIPVAVVKTANRAEGIPQAAKLLGDMDFAGEHIYLKCSYNSAHPFPATTHHESLAAAVKFLKSEKSRKITLLERSGMGDTGAVMNALGAVDLIQELGVEFSPLESLAQDKWRQVVLPGSNWKNGIEVPDLLSPEACVVQVCNLKTHRFGGEFSASLKNSIGLIPKYSPSNSNLNYMAELHASPYQCQMIAEVNQVYSPRLVIMDAVQVFVGGGPETGNLASPGIIAASRDRVAIDAVGLAILRLYGAGFPLNKDGVFDQIQIKRAVELELGAVSAEQIQLIPHDAESWDMAERIKGLLDSTPIF